MGPKKKVESEVELVKEVSVYRTPSYHKLFDAIGEGDIDKVEHVLQQKEKPLDLLRKKDLQGLTPLRKAISLNKSDICRLLITYGAEPSVRDPLGKTVLHRATSVGSRDLIAPLLVSPDSNVNIQDSFGWTPLHYAVRGKHQYAIDWLLFLGADVSLKNNEEHTAVDMCPADSVMLPYLRRLEARNVKEEPCDIACGFVGQYSMSLMGSDNRVKMVTSHDWPSKTQFMLGARKRPAYCLPPVPLRQDEEYFSEAVHYRLMYELPEGKTRVKVYFTVFEELSHTELVMKITSKTKFLGEVPVKMSTFLKNNYKHYLAGADLDLKNHGQFTMVKRPIKYILIRDDDGLLYSPEHDGFLLNLPEWALTECPEDFDDTREDDALKEREALMAPLLKKFALLMQDPKLDVYEDKKKAKDDDGDDTDANQSAQSVATTDKAGKKERDMHKKSYAPSTMDATDEEEEEKEEVMVLLDGTEPDNCEDFYYISRGWGLYLELRPNINSKLLLEIMEPGLGEESLVRCATMFYTMKHSSGNNTEDPFTVQIPKSEAYQWAPFVKMGTVLVYVRKALHAGEEEYPDPDDTVDETYLAEDGKSSRLEWWLQKERERWSLLPTGISNRQTRVIFDTNILSTYIAIQMTYGTEKWKSEGNDVESDEEGGGSDDDDEGEEGTEGGDGEDGEGGEGEDGGKKKKKKKKKPEGEDEGSKDDNESNNLLDDKSNNKQEDVSNNKFVPPQTEKKVSFDEPENDANKATQDKRGGFKPSDEPEAPAPSPQASDTTFKDKSNAECSDNESTDSDSNESTTDNDNNNSLGARGTDRDRNTNAATKESKSKPPGADSMASSKMALGNDKELHEVEMLDPYIALRMEERTNAVGMPTTSSSFFSLEPIPPPPEESDGPLEVESDENLPSRRGSRRMSLMVRKEGQLHLEEFEYGTPLNRLEFPEEIDMEMVAKEVAIMYRYRNHLLVTLCCFMRLKPNNDSSWDFVIELTTVVDLEVRAEMWMGLGYSLKARSANFPLKSNRQLNLSMQGGGVIFEDDGQSTPAGVVKLIEVFYSSSRTNCFQMVCSKPKEKGFKKAGGKKKDEKEVKVSDVSVLIELFFPGGNANQKKEVGVLNIFLDTPNLWLDNHVALRERDNPLLNRLVEAMTESEDVCLLWWKVWIFLGYTETEVEKEKGSMDWPTATKKILQRWFTDNLDNTNRGIAKLVAVLNELKQEETVENLISILKTCKVNEIMTEVKKPRYHAMLFHWLMETKISLNSLLKTETIDHVVTAPNSDQFLLRVADVLVIEDIHELGGAMEVEDNFIYTIKEEENILDPAYKTYRVLVKARAKNEDIVKYMVLLLEMVKRLGQPRRAGDFVVNETRKWMETVPDMKEMCNKLENLLATYVPNVDKKPSEANVKPKGGSLRSSQDENTMEEDD